MFGIGAVAVLGAALLWFARLPEILTVRQLLADPLGHNGQAVRVVGMADTREGAGREGAGARLFGEGDNRPHIIYTPAPAIGGDGVRYVIVQGQYDAEAQVLHAQSVTPTTDQNLRPAVLNRLAEERKQFPYR